TTYCECPNYDAIIPVLLAHGVKELPNHCRLTVGVPLKPMLAHPTKGVHEVFNRFEGEEFTCEWKYDGERAQIHFATSKDCKDMEEVQLFLDEAVRGSCEGLMKDYLEGVGDTIDVVVIGAYSGRGKRRAVFGGFLAACRDPDTDCYQALCKLGTGFSDEDLTNFTETLKKHQIPQPRSYYTPDAWFEPALVWEVRCADLSLSPAHRAAIGRVDPDKGISLRFPRPVAVARAPRRHRARRPRQGHLAQVPEVTRHCTALQLVWEVRCADLSLMPAHRAAIGSVDPDNGISLRFPRPVAVARAPRRHRARRPRQGHLAQVPEVTRHCTALQLVCEVRCADLSLSPAHRAAIGRVDPDKGISLRFPR
ncbi:DNA ligase, partial [Operophtera brumata]